MACNLLQKADVAWRRTGRDWTLTKRRCYSLLNGTRILQHHLACALWGIVLCSSLCSLQSRTQGLTSSGGHVKNAACSSSVDPIS